MLKMAQELLLVFGSASLAEMPSDGRSGPVAAFSIDLSDMDERFFLMTALTQHVPPSNR
jgi:hypothetical protein